MLINNLERIMSFPESVKLEAKRRAHYVCVICKGSFLEVHHIIPESDGGPNTLDNAAPLCAACHDQYGGNPDKRKAIREMRDFWWDLCEKRESNLDLNKLNEKLDSIQTAFQRSETTQQKAFEEIKAALVTFHRSTSDSVLASGSTIELSVKAGYQLPAFFAHFSSCPKCGASSVVARPVRDSSGNQYRECPQCSTRY